MDRYEEKLMNDMESVIKVIKEATAAVITQQKEIDALLVSLKKELEKRESFSLNEHREKIQPHIDRLFSQFGNLVDEISTARSRLHTACNRLVREKDEVDPHHTEYDEDDGDDGEGDDE